MKKFTTLFILFTITICFSKFSVSQKDENHIKNTSKNSYSSYNIKKGFTTSFSNSEYGSVQGAIYYFRFAPMEISTVYDIQSSAVPNQIWQDPLNPMNVHAVFMYTSDPTFAFRYCAYLFSNDYGSTWTFLGDVPSSGRSGFPSISGFTSGAAVIACNSTSNVTPVRAKLFYDAGAGFSVFNELDPGDSVAGLWPRAVGIRSDKIAFVTSDYSNTTISLNHPGTFSGYEPFSGSEPEAYWISIAPNGRLGHAFVGVSNGTDNNDVFYRYSDDEGLTWSQSFKIWDWSISTDSLGCLRGVSMVFDNNSQPHVAFNISKLTATGFFPELPSSIRVWSPSVNGGIPVIVADQNNVPFFPNKGNTADAFLPVCRPAIGRGSNSSRLFLAFCATTGSYGKDSSAYYGLWFAESNDNGNSWYYSVKFTPEIPLLDWRYVSLSQVNHSTNTKTYAQMIAQVDTVPGTYVNGSPFSYAEAIGIALISEVGITNISNTVPAKYSLAQNFPNPFNPETKIRFDIKENSKVTIKVYDMKGALVSMLADNVNVTPGTKEVSFNANGLSSGVYFYTMTSGEFSQTKKMILVR